MAALNVALQARKQRWRGHRSQLQGVRQRQWRSDHEGGVDDHHEQPGRAPQWGGGDHHDRGGWLGWRWQDQFCRVSEIDGKQNCLDVSSLKLIFLDFQISKYEQILSSLISSNSLDHFKKAKRVESWNCQKLDNHPILIAGSDLLSSLKYFKFIMKIFRERKCNFGTNWFNVQKYVQTHRLKGYKNQPMLLFTSNF